MATPKAQPVKHTASPAELRKANVDLANILKRTSPHQIMSLGTQSGTAGQTLRFRLQNTGLVTGFFVTVVANTTLATAVATWNARSLYALIPRVKLTDYAMIDRINCSAFQLFLINSLKDSKTPLSGMPCNVSAGQFSGGVVPGLINNYQNPNGNVTVSTSNQTMTFYVPVCENFQQGDLRGLLNANTTEGDAYLSFDIASFLNDQQAVSGYNDDYIWHSATGTATLNSCSITVQQCFYLPQAMKNGKLPIPFLDVHTVHEIMGTIRSTDNLATGSEKLINLPNNRRVNRTVISWQVNGILGGDTGGPSTTGVNTNSLNRFRLLIGGSTAITDETERLKQFRVADRVGAILPAGCYEFNFPNGGLETNNFGTAQIGVTPNGSVTNAYLEIAHNTLYPQGGPLSHIPQAA